MEELPLDFTAVPIDILVVLIADMLERLMAHNDLIPLLPESLTRFHSRSAPVISVLDYLRRIVRFTNVEKSCLLVTLHYIDQICSRTPLFTLSSLTCHRFIIASITVSSKGLCDTFCTNSLYAKVGGISVTELDVLEREFLEKIDWRLMCTREVLQEYYVNLVRTHSSGQYFVVGAHSSTGSTSSTDGDEMDTSQSRPPTPPDSARLRTSGSAILIEPPPVTTEVSRRPTIEQNMAFAALQQSQESVVQNDSEAIRHPPM
ncbi:cyclin-domain-containing protein [Mycena pura]|uniref:Cyclin-domain-containing protein n=1 Tax=Mycena pura TaxID=153505 RepID=A0AAD6VD68_9AGAR|nr:cyclin-domain-containing protein [Mycena pura]